MKKTILALLAVLILGVGAYYSLIEQEVSKTTMNVDETDFAVIDTSIIQRFFIAKKSGGNYQFKKTKTGEWFVNDNWKAKKLMVDMLLGTISELKIKAPVPKGMRNGVIKTLAAQGTKVELYTEEGLLKTFYVGDYTADEKGTYLIMEGSEQPYIVHIPRFNGYLSGRFKVNKDDFIDQHIFNSNRHDIKSLEVKYTYKPENSFKIENESIIGVSNIDSIKVKQYLKFYNAVVSKNIINTTNEDQENYIDSISNTEPFVQINLIDNDESKSNSVKLYEVGHKDNMIAYIYKGDKYAWVQYYVFNKLLVEKSNFIKKEMAF